jgi:orotidine-5'-phosphate decarboxylase
VTDVIVALDVPSRRRALALVDELGHAGGFYKVGLELFTREGPGVLRALRERGKRIFLDLKLLDIPNTVAAAVRAAVDHDVDLLTVHTTGGVDMMSAAAEAAGDRIRLLGVTLLTSLATPAVETIWNRAVVSLQDEVVRLAELARSAGIHGVVSSAHEAAALRSRLGADAYLVTPGIRLAHGAPDDQARVMTPAQAVRAGANALVVGRPITGAPDPAAALADVLRDAGSAT